MILRWYIILLSGILFLPQKGFAQPVVCGPTDITPGGSVRLEIVGGGNLDFVFNSIAKYTSGITTPVNWTTLGISVTDVVGGTDYLRWELSVEAQEYIVDGVINGTDPLNTIPISSIQLSAAITLGCGTCNDYGSPFVTLPLPGFPTLLVDGTNAASWPPDQILDVPDPSNLNFATDQIGITYSCGVAPAASLLGSQADYYADIDIVFILCME